MTGKKVQVKNVSYKMDLAEICGKNLIVKNPGILGVKIIELPYNHKLFFINDSAVFLQRPLLS